jgi:hypothetical protein
MGEAVDIEFSPPVAVWTEPHPTKKNLAFSNAQNFVGRAKLRLSRDRGWRAVFSAKSCVTGSDGRSRGHRI